MKVSVSVLKEYDRLISAIKKVNESKADYLHIDVMDGIFVDNKKFPLEVCKDTIRLSTKKTDVHLMVNSTKTVEKYADLNPDMITFHVEIIKDTKIIDYVKEKGIKIGLAINPETDIKELIPYINDIDLVLFMSVHPGLGGQEFIKDVLKKVKQFKKFAPDNIIISIDGGVNDKTAPLCKNAGCDMLVCGSYVTNSDNYDEILDILYRI